MIASTLVHHFLLVASLLLLQCHGSGGAGIENSDDNLESALDGAFNSSLKNNEKNTQSFLRRELNKGKKSKPKKECAGVWAYETHLNTCFTDIEGNNDRRLGWSVGPLLPGSQFLDLYAGATECDIESGTMIGQVEIFYEPELTSELRFDWTNGLASLEKGQSLQFKEVYWYAGPSPMYKNPKNGKFTVKPEKFPYKEIDISSPLPSNVVQYDVGKGGKEPLYLSIYALVCDAADDTECENSEDCSDSEYCLQGTCANDGQCLADADCFDPDNVYFTAQCIGPISCNEAGQCSRTCTNDSVPCRSSEDCSDSEYCLQGTCANDGQCLADADCFDPDNVYFTVQCIGPISCNEAGQCFRTCTNDSVPCRSSEDCSDSEYCLQGTCAEGGQCLGDADCFNPDNIYFTIQCVGPISCNESGQCGRTCTENSSPCPDGVPLVRCFAAPCDNVRASCADEFVSCVDNYCGGCNYFAFDAAGNEVCQNLDSSS